MPTEKGLSNLIINKVESKEVYNYMVANNLVNEDEMYLVQGDDEVQIIVDSALNTTSENPVQNKVVATAINNLNTLVGDTPVSDQINTAVASKADASDLTAHTGNSNIHITSTERTNWNAAKAHADSAHAPSNAEENQNAFSNIIVGGTTIAADTKTDTLTIVAGNNVTLTPDAKNDKLTIAATDTVYTHPTYTSKNSGLYKITVDGTGHVSATTAVSKSDITALGIPAQDTTYSTVTTSADGLMSAADKSKLDGIATGANKTTVDSTLSSTSTNPVQNKVVNTAISALNTLVGDAPVATQITSAINDAGFLTIDLNSAESGTVPFTNSDMLGGLPASSYLQVANFPQALTDAGVVKSVAGKTPNASGEVALVPADIGAVPTSRTVNGKALSDDISLTYSDVGAAAASHTHDSIMSPDCLALTWSGDHMLSSTDRPSQKLHFGENTLYRYNSSNNSYYPIYDNGNLTFSLSGTTLTITKS